jgi:CBS domain-containing protein
MATKAREIMTGGVECIGEDDSVLDAAKRMDQLGVGALPICGRDDKLKGLITDRDITIKVVAKSMDPATTRVGEFAQGKPVTIGADDSLDEVVRTMAEHKVKRLPVIDGHRMVGIITEADVARSAPQDKVINLVQSVYADA